MQNNCVILIISAKSTFRDYPYLWLIKQKYQVSRSHYVIHEANVRQAKRSYSKYRWFQRFSHRNCWGLKGHSPPVLSKTRIYVIYAALLSFFSRDNNIRGLFSITLIISDGNLESGNLHENLAEIKDAVCRLWSFVDICFRRRGEGWFFEKSPRSSAPSIVFTHRPLVTSVDVQTFWWAIFHVELPTSIATTGTRGETRIWLTLTLLCPSLPHSSLPKPTVSFSTSARLFCTQSRVSGRAICNSGGTHRRTDSPKNCRCIICNSKEHRNLRNAHGWCGKKGQADDEIGEDYW